MSCTQVYILYYTILKSLHPFEDTHGVITSLPTEYILCNEFSCHICSIYMREIELIITFLDLEMKFLIPSVIKAEPEQSVAR